MFALSFVLFDNNNHILFDIIFIVYLQYISSTCLRHINFVVCATKIYCSYI